MLQQLNIPYIVVDFNQGVEVKLASIRLMGQAMSRAERGGTAGRRIAKVSRIPGGASLGAAAPPVTYIGLGTRARQYGGNYGASIWGAAAWLAGADNIAAGVVSSPSPLRADMSQTRRPEVIFLAGGSWENMPNAVPVGYGTRAAPTDAPDAIRPAGGMATTTGGKKISVFMRFTMTRAHDLRFYLYQYLARKRSIRRVCRC